MKTADGKDTKVAGINESQIESGLLDKKEEPAKKSGRYAKRARTVHLENSIFDLAYFSLLDPYKLDKWDKEFPETYAYSIKMTRKEQTAVF